SQTEGDHKGRRYIREAVATGRPHPVAPGATTRVAPTTARPRSNRRAITRVAAYNGQCSAATFHEAKRRRPDHTRPSPQRIVQFAGARPLKERPSGCALPR